MSGRKGPRDNLKVKAIMEQWKEDRPRLEDQLLEQLVTLGK